jgi:sigma-B regulation protein RsbU (phosphoserine phosphatase)
MKKFELFHLKNEMLAANFLANFIGAFFVNALMLIAEGPLSKEIWKHPIPYWIDATFTPFAFTFVIVMTLLYEKPIRYYLNALFKHATLSPELKISARQRLLNEPFVLIALDFSMWLLAAIVYPILHWVYGTGSNMIQRSVYISLATGFITVTIAFFFLEHISQKRLAPHFFPEGKLYTIPKTLRIRIRTRLVALLFACNLIPLFSIIHIFQRVTNTGDDPLTILAVLRSAMFINSSLFILAGVCLTMLVSRNLTLPFGEIIQTLRGVRNGILDKKVQVTSNDEIGYTGDVINEMTEGLKEREKMRHSLDLAKEVQQYLMPASDPRIKGLDIAGKSIYCEETGGDYYDYLPSGAEQQGKIGLVVGDVSDHGIPSALLMTTARAFLRQRFSQSGNLNQIVTDVNRQLSQDVKESGRFMTLFLCEIDRQNEFIHWVNAGHEPGMIYDRHTDEFVALTGGGLPLGVSQKSAYQKFQRAISPGQIILIGTDGIWEAQNQAGEMFGKERFNDVIRKHAKSSANLILDTVINSLDSFQQSHQKTDDVTLVVIKIEV